MRLRCVFFFKRGCSACEVTHRDVILSGVDMHVVNICIDDHEVLSEQPTPALFVSDLKRMMIGSSDIMGFVRELLIETQRLNMQANSAKPTPSSVTTGGSQVAPPTHSEADNGPSAIDWTHGDGQSFSWISSGDGGRQRGWVDYDDASAWISPPAASSANDAAAPGRGCTSIGLPRDDMTGFPPPGESSSSASSKAVMSMEHLLEIRKKEEASYSPNRTQ